MCYYMTSLKIFKDYDDKSGQEAGRMHTCPRCGKHMSTEQSLCYHLSKKRRCDSLQCKLCQMTFQSKYRYRIHLAECNHEICETQSKTLTQSDKIVSNNNELFDAYLRSIKRETITPIYAKTNSLHSIVRHNKLSILHTV